jgi:hypothetical protein
MRKLLISLGLLFLAAAVGATGAVAGPSSTVLGTSSSSTVSFTTGMGDTGMFVGASSGAIVGVPTGPLLTTATSWSTSGGTLTLKPVIDTLSSVSVYAVTGTIPFTLTDKLNNVVLTGTLSFPVGPSSVVSLTNNALLTLNANLEVTGGSICLSLSCPDLNNTVQLSVVLAPYDPLHRGPAFTGGTFLSGNVIIGNGAGLVTPEPTSMLLFGTGLLAFGGILRRKLLA